MDEYIKLAEQLGFTTAKEIDPSIIVCNPDIRALCNPEACPNYGTNWICPPGCGELDALEARLRTYSTALLLQSKTDNVDTSDKETLLRLNTEYGERIDKLMKSVHREHHDAMVLTTGGCHRCRKCAYPKRSCRHSRERQGSISAHGIDVAELSKKAGIDYEFVPENLCFVGIVLI